MTLPKLRLENLHLNIRPIRGDTRKAVFRICVGGKPEVPPFFGGPPFL